MPNSIASQEPISGDAVSESSLSDGPASPAGSASHSASAASVASPTRVLHLGGSHDGLVDLASRLEDEIELVSARSSLRALMQLEEGEFAGVYVDADHFCSTGELSHLLRTNLVLQGMADGVVLLDAEKTILWGNRRLQEWTGVEDLEGRNLYDVLNEPEILGPDFSPLQTALASGSSTATTLRSHDNRYFRLHAAPVLSDESKGSATSVPRCEPAGPRYVVATIRDVSEEVVQQQKLAAIHQAGIELADLMPDDVANLNVDERIALLKDNILHSVQEVLNLDVIEIRTLNHATGELKPLMAVGMEPEAERRKLYAARAGNGVTGFVAATGKSYLCSHTTEDPLYIEGARGARSSLTVPLLLHDEVIGTLNVENPEANAFCESDLQFVEIFARDLALALNTLELLAAEQANTAAASVEAIHSAVAMPVDVILNDAVNAMERYMALGQESLEPEIVQRLQRILTNARDIKIVIHQVGQTMAPCAARPARSEDPFPWLAGVRILVVDEDDNVRSAAHSQLDNYGCIVETAHNGNEACYMVRNLAKDQQYDVIIADIRLPDMNGYEFLVKLREIVPHPPLALMTGFGYDPEHSIVRSRKEGLRAVLYKPFRLEQLMKAIEPFVRPSQGPAANAAAPPAAPTADAGSSGA